MIFLRGCIDDCFPHLKEVEHVKSFTIMPIESAGTQVWMKPQENF